MIFYDINSDLWSDVSNFVAEVSGAEKMSALRKYGTCFFERYAQISLSELFGGDFCSLINRDRPDLQSPDGVAMGIEVTRAMDESKTAADQLLKEIAGITPAPDEDGDLGAIMESGYAYGLRGGRYIGHRELDYWSRALPLRRIIESKISKAGNGFYGRFDKMGLYVFCKDPVSDADALRTCLYAMNLQKYNDIRYNDLYLSEVGNMYVCNLDDGLSEYSRIVKVPITQEQRKSFYLRAVRQEQD